MGKAYIIAEITKVKDEAGFGKYRQVAIPTLQQYGVKPLAVVEKTEKLEGDWQPTGLVLLEFESVEKAREWYESPEYGGQAIPLRQAAADTNMILFEGF